MLPGIANMMLVGSGTSYELVYCGSLSGSKVSSVTGSIDIGSAHADREIFIVSYSGTTATLTAASTTVNSVAVTKATSEHTGTVGSLGYSFAIGFAAVPSGSGSVTVTATYSAGCTPKVAVYRVVGRPGKGNNETDSFSNTAASGTGVSLTGTTINAGGLWFGAYAVNSGSNIPTPPTGTSADYDFSSGAVYVQINSRPIQANSTTPTDTWNSGTSTDMAASSWAFA